MTTSYAPDAPDQAIPNVWGHRGFKKTYVAHLKAPRVDLIDNNMTDLVY